MMNDSDYPLLATKLYIPKPPSDFVRRIRLIEKLNKGIGRKLTLISAPAGFGKTTLLSEWIDQSQWPVVWISLDDGDNDPVHFLRYMIAALTKIEPGFGESTSTLMHFPQQLPLDAMAINLIREIEKISYDIVLIIDDYHSVEAAGIHRLVELLVDQTPPQMHLVVATRIDPNLPLARLRAGNQLNEFRVSDLGFTMGETAQFLNQVMHLGLSSQDIEMLESRTEGWIAGLQLAALSMQGRSDVSSFIRLFAGDDRHIVDYLTEEVLNRQPRDIQEFLLQTSILNRLSEGLCDYVTHRQGSQNMLEHLEKANLFLVPLDNKRCWYRYHHLFADLLRQRLHQRGQGEVRRLHLNASEWFDANTFKEDAIEHALAAKEYNRAADFIEAFILARWEGGEQVVLFKWLDQLPDEVKLSKPNLGICHAKVMLESGRTEAAEESLERLEHTHLVIPDANCEVSKEKPEAANDSTARVLQGRIAAVKAYMASRKGDLNAITVHSKEARAWLPKNDSVWHAVVAISSAIAHEIQGDSNAAIGAHSEAVAAARAAGNVYLYLIARLWLAIVLKNSGQLPEAINICQQLLREVNDKKLAFNVAVGHVWGTWGEMLYELNDLDEANRYAKKGIEFLKQGHDVSHLGWRYCCLAKILCSKQDLAGAEEIAVRMDRLMRTSYIPPWILTHIKAVKAQIFLMKNDGDAIEKWVDEGGLNLDDDLTILHEAEHIMLARILLDQGRLDDALGLLGRLIEEEEKTGRVLNQIETLNLQALALEKIKQKSESRSTLKKALSLAEPGGYVRVFVDHGPPMAELLKKIYETKEDVPRAFVRKLLPEFKLRRILKNDGFPVEPLSDRELEVLRFIAAGLSNKKISDELFISLSTVKTHLRNIYGKLDVHSRTEAIVKAKESGVLQ